MPVFLATLLTFAATISQRNQPIRLEAEKGVLHGTSVSSARTGYSGAGYVTGFTKDGDSVVLNVDARPGIYEAKIRYSAPSGPKGYGLNINGSEVSGMFAATGDKFGITSAGKIELVSGHNTIQITKGWGYFDVDYIDLVPAVVNTVLRKPRLVLADSQAAEETLSLLRILIESYGMTALSGQYDRDDTSYIETTTGQTPAIYGADFMDYSPSRVAFSPAPKDLTEKTIQRAKSGQIVTMSWHWNAPTDLVNQKLHNKDGSELDASWYKGFYTNASTFDLQVALNDPKSERYGLMRRDIDAIAVQLKKFSKAGIPILWRPLHEAEGGWFWWGAKGSKPFVKLWRLLFDRLTNVHHLHNLIWVFTIGSNSEWYPGDKYVDIIGVDAYPNDHSDPLSSTWESLKSQFDGRKLLAISEFGGVPDIPRMRRFGVDWSYFVSWPGGIKPPATSTQNLKRIYGDKSVRNRE